MSTAQQQVELAVIDFVKSTYEANKPAVLTAINQAEGGVEAFIVNAIKNAPKPGGLLGTLYGILEPQLETYVKNLVAQAGAEVVYTFIDDELAHIQHAVGG